MNRKQVAQAAAEDAMADVGYIETDPSGRYGRFEEVLGRGAMKTVYKAIDEVFGVEVAWNQVKLNQLMRSPSDLQRLYSEVHLLRTLKHDSIIRFYTSWIDVDRKTFNFITELFTSGTLREYRKRYKRIDIRAIKSWARQVLQGLVYLHSHNPPVIHRDLKCDNIFVNGHLGQVKIGDLGLAAILQGSKSAHSVIGTPEFMAPELYEEDYNELVDVYSFGMCVLEMLTCEYPYNECNNPAQIYKKVTSGKLPGSYYRIRDLEAQRFIGKCLTNAAHRLSAEELLVDQFLASDEVEILSKTNLNQNPFLNGTELEKLQLDDDPPRTDMKITGKLNPEDDTIILKVQIADKDGPARNIYFPFDIVNDTPLDVANEMVKELEITDWDPTEIAEMIDEEISALFEEVLGRGAMKTVYKAIDEVFGVEVAWNQVKLNQLMRSPSDLQRLYSEVHLLRTLKHDSIIRFYTSWIDVDRKTFNFITELFTSGTLREYRKRYKRIDIRAIKSWARQVLQGLVYLHSHNPPVIHRDLKCDNIFVNGHLGQVKIGDLGLAAILQGSKSAHSVIGTPEFMAPELYEEDYNELVDVYSFGMCVLEMLTCEYPYNECNNPAQIYKKVTSGKLPGSYYRIRDLEAQRFIGKCLTNAAHRLSAEELLVDQFLASDEVEILSKTNLNQNPFLNGTELEKLQLDDDPPRTDMKITGKLNPEDDTIILKVQIADKDGPARNIYFPFDIVNDTPLDVANEMVKELEITDWDPTEIAEMIDEEISALVPQWKRLKMPHSEAYHTFNYHEHQDANHHPFYSVSSCSSSQVSLPGLVTHGHIWLQDDFFDDASSHSSSRSGTYSNLNYLSGDEHITSPVRGDKHLFSPRAHNSTRFCPEGNSCRQCKVVLDSNEASSSKSTQVDSLRLTRNRSLVDVRSQLLHRQLVEEVHKRRLFNTVGAVENVGFQDPCEVSKKVSRKSTKQNLKS